MRLKSPSWRSAVPCAAAALLVLTGCAPSVGVAAATDSNNPACAPMMVSLPDTLAGAQRRTTTSQATAAWGNPSLVILRCGVEVPGPTTARCVGVNGVDWIIKEGDPDWTMTTYGRNPAAEVTIDPNKIASSSVLAELSNAADKLPKVRACVGPADVENLPSAKAG
ncbi:MULTISPECIES: DUF3515 domain-containing protein [unclassified Arthrobacter]|uniref:DUF3515 domain-containing protein n=1 Tax=unclassified Arthrobacter TaxID=235627 RepID=UPI00159D443A|nr:MULTISPECIES: DUF3515 domain-containing protein [unclassified Arthrobacter]MCQ9163197.1 DUF3515 domain-containing protein [Arthrobacter sp. STN4]NVM98559.1 DUF3515 domain-containing protein [Arthrobacter sp. SDTb3-6]